MQQEQPGTVTCSHISSLLISRRLIRPRVASQYPGQTSSYFKQQSVQRSGRKSNTSVYLVTIRVRVRAGSGYIVKYRLPDLWPCIQHPVTGPLDTSFKQHASLL